MVTIESTFGVDDQTAGSGFVVNARRGLITTASHVVTKAQKGSPTVQASAVYIVLGDGTRVDAHVLGYDLFEDTALLQVDPKHLGLQALPLGRARSLRVGDPVAVIGSPFENRASLSTGVVSQLDRQIDAPGVCFPTTGVVQTDAAVNPGNSGGPLLDADGAVVGMVTAINLGARGGVAYAVPMEAVREAYEALARGRHVDYAWLGVSAATLTPPLADSLGLGVEHGALVQSLTPGRRGRARRPAGRDEPGRGRRAGVSARRRRDRRRRSDAGRGLPRPRSRNRRPSGRPDGRPARRAPRQLARRARAPAGTPCELRRLQLATPLLPSDGAALARTRDTIAADGRPDPHRRCAQRHP